MLYLCLILLKIGEKPIIKFRILWMIFCYQETISYLVIDLLCNVFIINYEKHHNSKKTPNAYDNTSIKDTQKKNIELKVF